MDDVSLKFDMVSVLDVTVLGVVLCQLFSRVCIQSVVAVPFAYFTFFTSFHLWGKRRSPLL